MTAAERRVRDDLAALAASDQGRRLLQLALRGIQRGEREVTAGCWTDRGVAGCLFQHAYWQGVDEGVFSEWGRPGDWVGSFVGSGDYDTLIRTIGSFDRLARSEYADLKPRALLPDRICVRQQQWRTTVERVLVETLAEAECAPKPASQDAGASTAATRGRADREPTEAGRGLVS